MSEDGILETFVYETLIIQRKPDSVPARFAEDWAQHAIAVIDTKMIPGWTALLVTEEHFVSHMATPAADGYAAYLEPGRLSRKGIPGAVSTQRHQARLAASYVKLQASIERLLVDARADFEQRLLDTQETYRVGEALPLSLTGDYFEQVLGAAVRQWFFLGSTAKFPLYRWASDVLRGDIPPLAAFVAELPVQDVAKRLVRLLIQGGCLLLQKLSVDTVHERLDTLLAQALAVPYGVPPQSTIRLFYKSGLPVIRTEIKRLVVPRFIHHPPQVPNITLHVYATENPHIPGSPDARHYHATVIADIQHLATFFEGYEYESFTLYEPSSGSGINLERSESSLVEASFARVLTYLSGPYLALRYCLVPNGLGYGVGEGAFPIRHLIVAFDHTDHTRHLDGGLSQVYDQFDGTVLLEFHVLNVFSPPSGSNWDVYKVHDGSELVSDGLITVGQVLDETWPYTIQDNFGDVGFGTIHLTVEGVA